ncbi:hypothetical protein Q4595_17645, partial [Wenyingzhuangia sp. 1_MG-2023]|nr:hypothetical protein [Wenyingzhuangia sp. 1_MG-2023]
FKEHDLNQAISFDLFKHSLSIRTGISFLIKELAEKTHYYSYIQFAIDKSAENIAGWVISDSMADIVLVIAYNDEEEECNLNIKRPDLVEKNMTDIMMSGFKYPVPKDTDLDSFTVRVKGTDFYVWGG